MSKHVGNARREFIAGTSLMGLGMGLWPEPLEAQALPATPPRLREGLSLEELEIVKNSRLAGGLRECFGKGHSCAESGLLASLRFLGKPEELVWVAGGFGGGLVHGDLCGFLTSGAMAIGLLAGMLPVDEREAKKQCQTMMRQYWQDWAALAPLHCAEIRRGHKGFKVCLRVGLLAFAKLETRMAPAMASLTKAS